MPYWEIGGAGGPAGAGGGTETVIAGGAAGVGGAAGAGVADDAGSGVLLDTAVEMAGEAGGAGVTGGTGSARNAGGVEAPVSFGGSILADSGLASGLAGGLGLTRWLAVLFLGGFALRLVLLPGLALGGFLPAVTSALGSSSPGLPRLLSSFCLPAVLRPSGPCSSAAWAGA